MYGIGHVGGLPSNPLRKHSKPAPVADETPIEAATPIDDNEATHTMPTEDDTNSRHRIINLADDINVVGDDKPYRILNLADDG